MLRNNKFLLDEDCPMCKIYAGAFVNFGLMDKDSVAPYQSFDMTTVKDLDVVKATSEIALVDNNTGLITYGIDSIIRIVAHGNSTLKTILKSALIYPILKVVYSFISFNRKVIYITKDDNNKRACNPPLNKKYRWAYIGFVALVTALILNKFTDQLFTLLLLENNPYREYLICFGQILWQGLAILYLRSDRFYDYLGNMSTVSLIGGLLLLPLLWTANVFALPLWVLIIYFGLVVTVMLAEHIRRCRIMEIPIWATFSWVSYRLVVLSIILLITI